MDTLQAGEMMRLFHALILAEDLDSVPKWHMMTHICLQLHLQGIRQLILAS